MRQNIYKADFPIFQQHPNLTYLDSAATSQKPQAVIEAINHFYRQGNANIHRGLYPLAVEASQQYQAVRAKVANFIHADSTEEIVFTRGTTDGINLVADAFLGPRLQAGDEVLITAMEHHANLIPWQQICQKAEAHLRVLTLNEKEELDLEQLPQLINERTQFFALTHISNSLGTINPIQEIIGAARKLKPELPVLIDAAQSVAHYTLDVQAIDCNFLVFSGHKAFGPTGIGVLYAKQQDLAAMQPQQFGGDMIESVSFDSTQWASGPRRFEAGTMPIASIMGLGAAIDYIRQLDREQIQQYLKQLQEKMQAELSTIPGLRIIGEAKNKAAIVSFILEQAHPHDVATFLGAEHIAIRAGHHCTQPLMDSLGLPGTVRASLSIYNTKEDVEQLVEQVRQVANFFQ